MRKNKKPPNFNDTRHEAEERISVLRAILASATTPIQYNLLIAKMCQTGKWKGNLYDATFFLRFALQNDLINRDLIS